MPILSESDVSQRSRIIESLHALVDRTEQIYLKLGKTLPDLMKELDRGFGEARTLVGYFTGRRSVDMAAAEKAAFEGDLVGDVLHDARAVIGEASSFFSAMEESDQTSFQSINGGIQNLSQLDEKLKAIREDSEEMELISLNAMTVALKAGQSGRAFSVITEELKALSTETIAFTEKLTAEGRKILDLFFDFRRKVEKIQKFQESFYAGFREKLEASFENFRLGVGRMADILMQVIDGAAGTKTPLVRIMEEIQGQDIIRQSIQHVVLSLSEDGGENRAVEGADEELDELSFSAMLPDLSCTLLKDVETNLSKGLSIFQGSLSDLRAALESAEKEKKSFLEYFGSGDNALEKMFEQSIEGMSGLLSNVERSMTDKAKLSPDAVRILDELKLLQESFEDFVSFVERFRTVDIAARIELAKQEVLRAKRDTMGSLTGLAGRIGVDVRSALDIILATIERIETTITRFSGEVTRGSARVSGLVVSIRGVYARLTQAKDFLSHTMREFSLYTKRFFTLIDELEGAVGELLEMITMIESAESDIGELKNQLLARKESALARRNLPSWTIHSDKLKNMIEKFTILSHKKTAAELGGIHVEEGSRPGELTLF